MNRSVRTARRAAIVLVALGSADASAIPHVALEESVCDLTTVAPDAVGLVVRPGYGNAVLSHQDTQVYTVYDTCQLRSSFDTAGLGAGDPTGIGFDADHGAYGIVDATDLELYLTNISGSPAGQCDLAAVGVTSPVGVAYHPEKEAWAVLDHDQAMVYVVRRRIGVAACELGFQFSIAGLGITDPATIGYRPDLDAWLLLDASNEVMASVDVLGAPIDTVDLSAIGQGTPAGVAWDPDTARLKVAGSHLSRVDTRGTLRPVCSTTAQSSTDATGIGLDTVTGNIVYVDTIDDAINIVDPDTCATVDQISLYPAGVGSATDVAWIDLTNEIVVGDNSSDDLHFFDATTGVETSVCKVPSPVSMNLSGVDYLPELDLIALTNAFTTMDWYLVDTACNLVYSRSAGPWLFAASTDLQDVAWQRGTGNFALVDNRSGDVSVVSFEGIPQFRFHLGAGVTNLQGIVAIPGAPGAFYVLDRDLDEIRRLDMPALTETTSLSGRFTSPAATLYLWDRGEGSITGTAIVGPSTLPVFGHFDGTAGSLAIGATTGPRAVGVMQLTVSPDRNTLTLPPPLGELTRTF
ncbi:MAG: hypothetical protein H6738_04020 [Alphaproteobacteria bacterium]|nr:hypothetical protein [Alphaproteobacteria bacterium]MCB9695937.1 hypothetical protein [Alphaproteobacteria bacterium]